MHPPLRTMPPLAAAATECRIKSLESRVARKETTGSGHHPCVRLHGHLVVEYLLRAVGSSSTVPKLVHKDPPRPFDKVFYLYDPDAFFRSYPACREIIHQMLAQTPVVGEFDLAADNWDDFLPHDLATFVVGGYRRATDPNMGAAPAHGSVDVFVTVRVHAVYSEPRALLLACKQVTAAHCRLMAARGGVAASECYALLLPWS